MNNDDQWFDIVETSKCIFCNQQYRRRKNVHQKLTKTISTKKIDRIFRLLNMLSLTNKLEEFRNARFISYHVLCLTEIERKLMNLSIDIKEKPCDLSSRKSIHTVKIYLEEKLIEQNDVCALTDIYNMYKALFEEARIQKGMDLFQLPYKAQHLLKTIFDKVPNLTKTVYKNRIFIHKTDLSIDELYQKGFQKEKDLQTLIKSVAFEIRRKIMEVEKRNLPKNNITLKDILEGECDIPEELHLLIECLLKGPRGSNMPLKEVKIASICNSIIFSMSNGSIKPSTCLTLGLAVKSITGSRKMINILNRLGHCVSYTLVEELETELAYGSSAETRILPYGLISGCEQLHTHVAFDNYDRFVETLSGKDTLHDTVGIVYQNISTEANINNNNLNMNNDMSNHELQSRRRKYFSSFDNSIEPYIKGNQKLRQFFGNKPVDPENLKISLNLNNIWMFNLALGVNNIKRWFSWHSDRVLDRNPIQRIGYLPNINMSPTCDAVVQKTLNVSLNIANECNQKHIIVTYDLAIASKAYKIQCDTSPKFDRVFITLGSFHIELSYFKVCVFVYVFEFMIKRYCNEKCV